VFLSEFLCFCLNVGVSDSEENAKAQHELVSAATLPLTFVSGGPS